MLLIGLNFVSTNQKVSGLDNIPIFTARWFAVIIKTALSFARVIWGSWTIISCRCTINTSTAACTTAWWPVIMTTDGSQRIAAVCWVFRIWANDPLCQGKASLISKLVDFKRDLRQRRRRRQRERQKAKGLDLQNNNFARASLYFCTFLCRLCTATTWKCLLSRLVEYVNLRQRLSFLFLDFDTVIQN